MNSPYALKAFFNDLFVVIEKIHNYNPFNLSFSLAKNCFDCLLIIQIEYLYFKIKESYIILLLQN